MIGFLKQPPEALARASNTFHSYNLSLGRKGIAPVYPEAQSCIMCVPGLQKLRVRNILFSLACLPQLNCDATEDSDAPWSALTCQFQNNVSLLG